MTSKKKPEDVQTLPETYEEGPAKVAERERLENPPEPSGEVIETSGGDVPVESLQFPAQHGHPEVEVAKRHADGHEGNKFTKVFRIMGVDRLNEQAQEEHRAAVLSEAINLGLHPKAEPVYEGAQEYERYRDTVTTDHTFTVEVVPASIDHEPGTTFVPRGELLDEQPVEDAVTDPRGEQTDGTDANAGEQNKAAGQE